jgi:amino acid permease
MLTPKTKTFMQRVLEGVSTTLAVMAGLSFFVGGVVVYATGKADRLLAELVGIGFTFLCVILAAIAKYKAEDLEWEAENQRALTNSATEAKSQSKHSH